MSDYGFDAEVVEPILKQALDEVLKQESYADARVPAFVDEICAKAMEGLADLGLPIKFVVSCTVMQSNGSGLNSHANMHSDARSDGCVMVKWPEKRNREAAASHMCCIVTAAGFAV
uniref:Dynein light chain n=1 Tax=Rhizochromulina marina TaxID=1034831 RepID=A0A7S2SHJ6_9STRA